MSTGDEKRGSWGAEARTGTLRPQPARDSWSLADMEPETPAKNPLECIRHDAGSAVHSLHGFVELLSAGTFGPMTEAQLRSIHHLKGAAQRLFELIESSIELSGPVLVSSELRATSLSRLVTGIVHSSMRERSGVCIELECPSQDAEEPVLATVEPESFTRALNLIFDTLVESGRLSFSLRVGRTARHALVDVTGERHETGVTRSIPMQRIARGYVDSMSGALSNRSYLQLKRCEALLARQGATLQLAGDLSRLRIALPLTQK
jgi:hypothetical protein